MKKFKTASRTTLNIDQDSFNSGTINISANTDVVITEDITIDSVIEYIDLQGDNITIDGKGYTITVTVADYPGFIKNGSSSINAPCANCTIKNINVVVSGDGSLASNGGWIGQKYFGSNINNGNILFENCYSEGAIANFGGGIAGFETGDKMNSSTISFNNCYSEGAISTGGGISGAYTGQLMMNSSTISFNNCYSTGAIGMNSGGIAGYGTGLEMNSSTIELNNCYSEGDIGIYGGGIAGNLTGRKMISSTIELNNCYSEGDIGIYGGGIAGTRPGMQINSSTISFKNCYSTGAIGNYGGGIAGYETGNQMNSSTIELNNCYSTGAIGSSSGGISGQYTGSNVIANNCYTIGTIESNAGGIYGQTSTATHSNCIYTNGKSDDITVAVAQTADTWEDANALITIGTSTTNNDITDVWTNKSSGSAWIHVVLGCTDSNAFNYDNTANTDDGNCIDKVYGCTDANALNYDSTANIDDGNCVDKVFGCTDNAAFNYNASANTDDGTCNQINNNTFSDSKIDIPANSNIVLTENITINHPNEYIDLRGNNITIDGQGYIITVTTAGYQGFIKNGFNHNSGKALCKTFTAKNIRVESSGDGALTNVSSSDNHNIVESGKGWIGQSHFGFNQDDIDYLFENCSSNGTITNWGGGIVGAGLCRNSETGSVTFKNCYSTGDIGKGSGGITGARTLYYGKGGFIIKALNCYSMGAIGEVAGGIFGNKPGQDIYQCKFIANNCYTIGSIANNSSGIYGPGSNRSTFLEDYKCIYSNGKSTYITVPVAQTAGTWEDANALVTIGTNYPLDTDGTTNDVSDVWHNPDTSSSWTHRTSDQSAVVGGCTDSNALNYESNANTDDSTCIDKVLGCMNVNAFNYDSNANTDDESCIYLDPEQEVGRGIFTIAEPDIAQPELQLKAGTISLELSNTVTSYASYYSFFGSYYPSYHTIATISNTHTENVGFILKGLQIVTYNDDNFRPLQVIKEGDDDTLYTNITISEDDNVYTEFTITAPPGESILRIQSDKAWLYLLKGCTDSDAFNYDNTANTDDGSCVDKVLGCMDDTYTEYNSLANIDNESCSTKKVLGCMDDNKFNYDANANTDDGNCIDKVFGCMDDSKFNYDSNANIDDGNCIDKVFGCTNIIFSNYDESANIDDGSCITKIIGSLIDGYISGANGGLYDVNDLSTPIETFTTDSFGKYEISTQADQLPEVYTIKFEAGGIDISTGKTVTTELTSTSTKEKVLAGGEATLNVTPITSLVTLIVKKTEGTIDVNNLNESVNVVTTIFNIEESDLQKDFIEENDTNITRLVTQLETTTKSLAAAINNDSTSESVILDSIVNFMIEINNDTNSDTIDLADETNITGIVEQVETDNSEIVISETLKENATSLISQVNTKVEEIVQDNTKSFEDVITESVQLSISTENTLTGDNAIDLNNNNVNLTSVVNNIETNAEKVEIETIFQPVTGVINFCNDPDACNYLEEGDCKELDCAGTCGGPAYKDSENNCIVDEIM